jgi:hypothetical protein
LGFRHTTAEDTMRFAEPTGVRTTIGKVPLV